MIRVNRWTTAALTATFLLLTLLMAGTRFVPAEPAADKGEPASAKIAEQATEEKTAPPPYRITGSFLISLSAAEKEEMERVQRETWQIVMVLDMPSLEPQAVQYAIFDKDPVAAFVAQVKRSQSYSRQQLEKVDDEARKEQLRAIQIMVDWDFGFKDVTGNNLGLLTKRPAGFSKLVMSSNAPAGKKWIVTKTVQIEGRPVCWCIPIEVTTGQKIDITFNKSNTFDLRTVYGNVMGEPVSIGDKEQMKKLVDDSVRENFPEIMARETFEWGDVAKAGDDNWSLRYKYLAKFQGKDTKIMNQVFVFDAKGKFMSVKDVDGFPQNW